MFDVRLFAFFRDGVRPRRAALDIVHVPKCVAKLVFLIGTMRTPPGAIHFAAFSLETLGVVIERAA